jgi:hypothetical protein
MIEYGCSNKPAAATTNMEKLRQLKLGGIGRSRYDNLSFFSDNYMSN